ncbi:MAG: hypothetical protein EPN75_08710 [Beijerinckiaceae bacterium]|nr:MAG: hypothetical protein EPN75_08710 [Beijerinckiaceae bacterium]
MRSTKLLFLALAPLFLSGCAVTESLGLNDILPKPIEHYNLPIHNEASRAQPFAHPLGYATPDTAWTREGPSEIEPWTHK